MKPKFPHLPQLPNVPAGATLPKPIHVDIRPMGQFVGIEIEGEQNRAIFPLTTGRAELMIKELRAAIDKVKAQRSAA